jgi:hypothetical protein
MTSFCADYQSRNPDIPCVGVLISSGGPAACNLEPDALVGIAREAYDNSGVMTYAVGMAGADLDLLDSIALRSGTDCTPLDPDTHACEVTPGSGTTLLQALENIRDYTREILPALEPIHEFYTKVLECEWGIPDPPEHEVFNWDLINVVIAAPGQDDVQIGRVSGESGCGPAPDGWYYDDPESPSRIIACPRVCETIENMTGIEVSLLLGCETIFAE